MTTIATGSAWDIGQAHRPDSSIAFLQILETHIDCTRCVPFSISKILRNDDLARTSVAPVVKDFSINRL